VPVTRSEEVTTEELFPGFEMKKMISREFGSQAITIIAETLHPGGKIPTHRHKVEGAMYVYAGTGYLQIDGEGIHEVKPGMGLLVPANTWHSMWNDENDDLKYVTAHPAVDVMRELKD
jgi:quercetin dioxygenase-like cupin family protein